jgi:hypothetical protein
MSDSSNELDPRQIARRYTAQLKEILLGRAPAGEVPLTSAAAPQAADGVKGAPSEGVPPVPVPRVVQQAAGPAINPTPPPGKADSRSSLPGAGPIPNSLMTVGERLRRPQGRFAELLAQVQRLNQLNQLLRAFLPSYLHDHVTLARLDPDGWVVQTDSPAWAARLRYILPNLRRPLGEKLGIEVPLPQIRIAPPEVPCSPPPRRMIITDKTVQELEEAARQFSDPRLSAAVLRLAEHARQRNRQS